MKIYANKIFFLILVLLVYGCGKAPKSSGPIYGQSPANKADIVYNFAPHPLHNPTKLMDVYQPLMDYLNARLQGAKLNLEASKDYAGFEEKYKQLRPDFILPNPWQTLQAMKLGYTVIAQAGEAKDFKGIFIVRKDGGIKKPSDLKGKAISYPSRTALAACIMPQYFLYTHGINVDSDIENSYVGSQESSIMNVYLNKTASGATWPPPWRAFQKEYPEKAAELEIAWETESLINNSVMVRSNVPPYIWEQVQKSLVELHNSDEGKAILGRMETKSFTPATDKDYDIVRSYVERFEKEVHKVEAK